MASEVQLCNQALTLIGANLITELSDASTASDESVKCSLMYPYVRDMLFAQHTWNFLKKRTTMAKLEDVPVFSFANLYALPADYVSVITMKNESIYKFKVTADGIETDNPEGDLFYIASVTDPNKFSEAFKPVLVTTLAKELAYAYQRSASIVDNLTRRAEDLLRKAKQANARDAGSSEQLSSPQLLGGRLTGYIDGGW